MRRGADEGDGAEWAAVDSGVVEPIITPRVRGGPGSRTSRLRPRLGAEGASRVGPAWLLPAPPKSGALIP